MQNESCLHNLRCRTTENENDLFIASIIARNKHWSKWWKSKQLNMKLPINFKNSLNNESKMFETGI